MGCQRLNICSELGLIVVCLWCLSVWASAEVKIGNWELATKCLARHEVFSNPSVLFFSNDWTARSERDFWWGRVIEGSLSKAVLRLFNSRFNIGGWGWAVWRFVGIVLRSHVHSCSLLYNRKGLDLRTKASQKEYSWVIIIIIKWYRILAVRLNFRNPKSKI